MYPRSKSGDNYHDRRVYQTVKRITVERWECLISAANRREYPATFSPISTAKWERDNVYI